MSGRDSIVIFSFDRGLPAVQTTKEIISFLFKSKCEFHRTAVAKAFNSLDKLKNNPKITSSAYESVRTKLKGDILSYQPGGNYSFSQGSVGEAIGALNRPSNLSNKIIVAHDTIPAGVPTSGKTADFIFDDDGLYEIKTRVIGQPNGYGGDENLIDMDILAKLDKWFLANTNQGVHIKFTNYVPVELQQDFINLVTTRNNLRQNPLNLTNVHFYWDGAP